MEEIMTNEKNINEQIKLYDLEFKKHFFYHDTNPKNLNKEFYEIKCFDDNELYNFSKFFLNNQRITHIYNKLNKNDKVERIIKYSSFNCRHLFHDEEWLKFNSNNFICEMDEEYKEIYCNSINRTDMESKDFLEFVSNIEKYGYSLKYIEFDENDEEEYNNELLMWILILVEKNEK
jgi:hypothetical protein